MILNLEAQMVLSQFSFFSKIEPNPWDYQTGHIEFWYKGQPEFVPVDRSGQYRTAVVWEMCGRQRTPPGYLRCESFNLSTFPEADNDDDLDGWREVVYRYTGIYRGTTARRPPKTRPAICPYALCDWCATPVPQWASGYCRDGATTGITDICNGNKLDQDVEKIKWIMAIVDCMYCSRARNDDGRRCEHPKLPPIRPHLRRFGPSTRRL